jgi:hypothetical protein
VEDRINKWAGHRTKILFGDNAPPVSSFSRENRMTADAPFNWSPIRLIGFGGGNCCSFFAPFCLKIQQMGANEMCCDLYLFSCKYLKEMRQLGGY